MVFIFMWYFHTSTRYQVSRELYNMISGWELSRPELQQQQLLKLIHSSDALPAGICSSSSVGNWKPILCFLQERYSLSFCWYHSSTTAVIWTPVVYSYIIIPGNHHHLPGASRVRIYTHRLPICRWGFYLIPHTIPRKNDDTRIKTRLTCCTSTDCCYCRYVTKITLPYV